MAFVQEHKPTSPKRRDKKTVHFIHKCNILKHYAHMADFMAVHGYIVFKFSSLGSMPAT